MPRQTAGSILDTVEYCRRLLTRFPERVFPLLCPMVPFLDPGSTFFEEGDAHGYRIQFRSLEEHRQALVHPSWIRRLNYETTWLSREEIAAVSYDAVARLTAAKKELGVLPRAVADDVLARIDEARDLVFAVDATWLAEGLDGVVGRHGRTILDYNTRILGRGVSDQLYPIPRSLENRWFDELEAS
jgi:clorobiocin biosynthesis protein CloN6